MALLFKYDLLNVIHPGQEDAEEQYLEAKTAFLEKKLTKFFKKWDQPLLLFGLKKVFNLTLSTAGSEEDAALEKQYEIFSKFEDAHLKGLLVGEPVQFRSLFTSS